MIWQLNNEKLCGSGNVKNEKGISGNFECSCVMIVDQCRLLSDFKAQMKIYFWDNSVQTENISQATWP